jgi:hypothetical protein
MNSILFRFCVLMVAGWIHRGQLDVVEYLTAENRVLREQLSGRRLRLTRRSTPNARCASQDCWARRSSRHCDHCHAGYSVALVSDARRREVRWLAPSRFAAQPEEALRQRIALRRRSAAVNQTTPEPSPSVLEVQAVEEFRESIERAFRDTCKNSDMPPSHVRTVDADRGFVIVVTLGPSRIHSLTSPFAVHLEGTLVDYSESVVLLECAAAILPDAGLLLSTPLQEQKSELFRGVLADDIVRSRLTVALLHAFDAAQDACQQDEIRGVTWIQLPKG